MIPASDLSRIPRRETVSRNDEARRYARSEYGSSSIHWMLPPTSRTPGVWAQVSASLASLVSGLRARLARSEPTSAPLRAGAAAVHFAGEPVHAHPASDRPHRHTMWEAHATTSLLLPMVEDGETSEACNCHP